jgi:hypothetical protein
MNRHLDRDAQKEGTAATGTTAAARSRMTRIAYSITLSHTGAVAAIMNFAATTRGWRRIFNVPEALPQTHYSDFESVGRGFESFPAHQRFQRVILPRRIRSSSGFTVSLLSDRIIRYPCNAMIFNHKTHQAPKIDLNRFCAAPKGLLVRSRAVEARWIIPDILNSRFLVVHPDCILS